MKKIIKKFGTCTFRSLPLVRIFPRFDKHCQKYINSCLHNIVIIINIVSGFFEYHLHVFSFDTNQNFLRPPFHMSEMAKTGYLRTQLYHNLILKSVKSPHSLDVHTMNYALNGFLSHGKHS